MSRPPDDDGLWAAIADPSRRRVVDLLVARGDATATELARDLPFTRQAVTKHLAVLERAGLVESRPTGREVRYAVRPEGLSAATQAVADVAARWDSRLEAIKRLAEGVHSQSLTRQPPAAENTCK